MRAGTALSVHRFIARLALAASMIFAWLTVFEAFYFGSHSVVLALARTVLLYALSQTSGALLTPLSARGLRNGMRRSMILGVAVISVACVLLGTAIEGIFGSCTILAFIAFALLLGIYRALYWIPYAVEHHDSAGGPPSRGIEILLALIPALIGIILARGTIQMQWVLFGAAIALLSSLIPLWWIPDVYERFDWKYRETFGQLFSHPHRTLFAGALIDGIQGTATLLIWPLAIFLLLGWSFSLFGLLFSITLLIIFLARETLHRSTHRRTSAVRSLPVRIAIVSSAWVGRVLIFNPASIVVAEAYLHSGTPKINIDHLTFEQTSDGGHFVDEFTVLRELGLLIGRLVISVGFVVAIISLPIPVAFGCICIVAGAAAALSVLIESTRQNI